MTIGKISAKVTFGILAASITMSCGEATFSGSTSQSSPETLDSETPLSPTPETGEIDAKGTPVGGSRSSAPENLEDKKNTVDPEANPKVVTREFKASRVEAGSTSFDLTHERISQIYTLNRSKETQQQETIASQKSLSTTMESHKQGYTGKLESESFMQNTQGILDILIVIDNSGSMAEEQKGLSDKLVPLLSKVADSNWQIGVVTTDPKDACMRAVIKKGDSETAANFKTAIEAGIKGAGNEQGIRQAVTGLSCSSKWVRDNSTIAVLIVSDEDNCSDGKGCGTELWKDETYLINYLSSIRKVKEDARVYGLFHVPGSVCASAYNVGNQYAKAVTASGGIAGSICAADYSPTLTAISENVSTILKSQFPLAYEPEMNSLKVFVNNIAQSTGFSVNGKTLTFNVLPPAGAQIRVEYTHGSTPKFKEFSLSHRPYLNSVSVSTNGTVTAASAYTVDYENKKISFKDAPADNADIRIQYKIDEVLPRTFAINKDALENSISVTVNGSFAAVESFNKTTGLLTLKSSPPEASEIKIRFSIVKDGAPILAYELKTPWGEPKDLMAIDKKTGKPVLMSYQNETISFDPSEFLLGREIIVSYLNEATFKDQFDLPVTPIPGSQSILVKLKDGSDIECLDYDIIDLSLQVRCDIINATKLIVNYQTEEDKVTEFLMDEIKNADQAKWAVYVNNLPFGEFTREGNKITITKKLLPGSVVKLVVTTGM
jgi:hypothetical protein